jgi:FtsZ-binding cell division protein ZapB
MRARARPYPVESMSPDSIEAKFAALQAEVRSWEYQLRATGSLVTQHGILEERINRAVSDIAGLRTEINQRIHDLHDEQTQSMRREVENLHRKMDAIAERRDTEMKDLAKRREDGDLALEQKIEVRARECRGQNLALIAAVVVAVLALLQGIITQFT